MSINTSKPQDIVTIYFEDAPFNVEEGISVAAAVLGHTHAEYTCENPVTEERRAPYCMMGVCFECMMEIDGKPNQQACLISVREGMQIKRQKIVQEVG